jgi:hypothetical protein
VPGTDFYVWQARTSTVRVALDLIDAINAAVNDPRNGRDGECGGILLGRLREPHSIELCGFEPIRSEHHRGTIFGLGLREQQRVARRVGALARHKSLRPVGFFRTHLRPGLYLDQDDFGLMQEAFADPSDIALLIRPLEPGPPNAGIFVWEEGDIDRRQAALFPFDSKTLRLEGPIESAPEEQVARGRGKGIRVPSIPKPVLGWSIAAVAGLLLAAGGLQTAKHLVTNTPLSRSARPLNLQMRKKGDAITVDWDRKAASLRAASSAVLTIRDGADEQKLTLNRGDLEHGNVQFWPRSDNVSVRMDVGQTAAERSATGEVPKPAALAQSKPAQLPAPRVPAAKPLPYVESSEIDPVVVARYSDEEPDSVRVSPSASRQATTLPAPQAPVAVAKPERAERAALDIPATAPPAMVAPEPRNTPPPEPPKVVHRAPKPTAVAVLVRVEHRNAREIRRVVGHVPLLGRPFHGDAGDSFSPPRPVRPIEPRIPDSLARYVVGNVDVDVKLSLDKHGAVRNAEILSGMGSELAGLAANSATSAMWEPAYDGDRPVASDVVVHYRFKRD